MKTVLLKDIQRYIYDSMRAVGANEDHAKQITDIIYRATLRGVGHHDIYDFPSRIKSCFSKEQNPTPSIELVASYGAMEVWDGDNGLGEVCTFHILKRAEALADLYGIGYAAIRHTNHFLATYPYSQIAAEDGYIAIIYCHTIAAMPAPNRQEHVIGNSPMGFGVPDFASPIIFDNCMASCSYGDINQRVRNGQSIPSHWARDRFGNPSSDPNVVADGTGTITAVGEHKGYSLSILTEILTSVIANGPMIDQIHPEHKGKNGIYTHSVICINPSLIVQHNDFQERVEMMRKLMKSIDSQVKMPGESSREKSTKALDAGSIDISDELADRLNSLANDIGIRPI